MRWSSPKDLRAQLQKLWDKGDLLRPLASGDAFAPRRLRLSTPSSAELSEHFDEVRAWAAELRAMPHVRLVLREFRHRVLGSNALPDEVWLDSLEAAHAWLGKQKEVRRFAQLVQMTRHFGGLAGAANAAGSVVQRDAVPGTGELLLRWLDKRALAALELCEVWPRLLSVIGWLQAHPRPGIYLRQVDLPGVDSKFIEAHRGVLSELLDLALPASAVEINASGLGGFCRRYGFKDKPLRIRFRLLDDRLQLSPAMPDKDISLTPADFAQLNLPLRRVFMTENEINFLAFPQVPDSLVIFGAGYGFEAFACVAWLHQCHLYYWGDIDTHGFAILDQLRAHFPHAQSLLMDRDTLLAHADHWGLEPQALRRDLPRLTPDETALFNELRDNKWRVGVRLEQERIGFCWVQRALAALPANSGALGPAPSL